MRDIKVNDTLSARHWASDGLLVGDVYNADWAERKYTLVAPFCGRIEGDDVKSSLVAHTRINCFVVPNRIDTDPSRVGEALVDALIRENICAEPIMLMPHAAESPKAMPYGEWNWFFKDQS